MRVKEYHIECQIIARCHRSKLLQEGSLDLNADKKAVSKQYMSEYYYQFIHGSWKIVSFFDLGARHELHELRTP